VKHVVAKKLLIPSSKVYNPLRFSTQILYAFFIYQACCVSDLSQLPWSNHLGNTTCVCNSSQQGCYPYTRHTIWSTVPCRLSLNILAATNTYATTLATTPWRGIGGGSIAPLILNLDTRRKSVVSFTPRPLYNRGNSHRRPLDRRLGGPQSQSGRGGEEKKFLPRLYRVSNHGHPGRSPVTLLTELPDVMFTNSEHTKLKIIQEDIWNYVSSDIFVFSVLSPLLTISEWCERPQKSEAGGTGKFVNLTLTLPFLKGNTKRKTSLLVKL
jgi:hypothetical protein